MWVGERLAQGADLSALDRFIDLSPASLIRGRIEIKPDGSSGAITTLQLSAEISLGNVLLMTENKTGKLTAIDPNNTDPWSWLI
jgi:hypothetical protein